MHPAWSCAATPVSTNAPAPRMLPRPNRSTSTLPKHLPRQYAGVMWDGSVRAGAGEILLYSPKGFCCATWTELTCAGARSLQQHCAAPPGYASGKPAP